MYKIAITAKPPFAPSAWQPGPNPTLPKPNDICLVAHTCQKTISPA